MEEFVTYVLILMDFAILVVVFFMMLNFFRFHLNLVLKNNTTLEKMESERSNTPVVDEVSQLV